MEQLIVTFFLIFHLEKRNNLAEYVERKEENLINAKRR